MQAAGAAPADGCRDAVEETAQFLQGLADRELLGATLAVHFKDCGFAYEEVSRAGAAPAAPAVAARLPDGARDKTAPLPRAPLALRRLATPCLSSRLP